MAFLLGLEKGKHLFFAYRHALKVKHKRKRESFILITNSHEPMNAINTTILSCFISLPGEIKHSKVH